MSKNGVPRFPKPKILLVDVDTACHKKLQAAGYNVQAGTFGIPYAVSASNAAYVLDHDSCKLPNLPEQEILFVNCMPPKATRRAITPPGLGVKTHWQTAINGVIDQRPLMMSIVQDIVERILEHGGIVVVFLDAYQTTEYLYGSMSGGSLRRESTAELSNWSFCRDVSFVESTPLHSTEIDDATPNFDPVGMLTN